jgi:hypothetical protein
MPASKIMIIRHAEKPGVPIAADGIDVEGELDPKSLTAAGWQRAHALVSLFHPSDQMRAGLATPEHLFAASAAGGDKAKRPFETLLPLAESFDPALPIDNSIKASDAGAIAKAATKIGGVVLICWKHEDILAIAQRLTSGSILPRRWQGSRFDMVWAFDMNPAGVYEFTQIPELVMPGDQATLMD